MLPERSQLASQAPAHEGKQRYHAEMLQRSSRPCRSCCLHLGCAAGLCGTPEHLRTAARATRRRTDIHGLSRAVAKHAQRRGVVLLPAGKGRSGLLVLVEGTGAARGTWRGGHTDLGPQERSTALHLTVAGSTAQASPCTHQCLAAVRVQFSPSQSTQV